MTAKNKTLSRTFRAEKQKSHPPRRRRIIVVGEVRELLQCCQGWANIRPYAAFWPFLGTYAMNKLTNSRVDDGYFVWTPGVSVSSGVLFRGHLVKGPAASRTYYCGDKRRLLPDCEQELGMVGGVLLVELLDWNPPGWNWVSGRCTTKGLASFPFFSFERGMGKRSVD